MNDIGFVAAIGAHDDLNRVARFFFTDQIQTTDHKTILMPAHEYGGGVLAYTKAEKFFPNEAENVLGRDPRLAERKPEQVLKSSESQLSPAVKDSFRDVAIPPVWRTVTDFLRIVAESKDEMDAVSLHGRLSGLHARVYILHGTEDNVIPASEADWLAAEIPSGLLKAKVLSPPSST